MSKFVKIPAAEACIGMFVAELDRPWEESPFLLQGFTIESEEDQLKIMELCSHIVVDSGKSAKEAYASLSASRTSGSGSSIKKREVYTDQRSFDKEIDHARAVYKSFETSVDKLFTDLRSGGEMDFKGVQNAVDGIVSSVLSNPEACLLLQKMQSKGDYLFDHAMGTSIWAAAFGRQLGLPRKEISIISMAALLCDTGMISVPDDIILKADKLGPEEFELVKGHVQQSLNHIRTQESIPKQAQFAVMYHHERFNGSGYPAGLAGDDIPLAARIIAIADTYDAMSNHRAYASAKSPADAVRELYALRNIEFQEELIEEFIQAVGIYPAGTLVEISNGKVGMVVAEYRGQRLRPRIIVLTDENKNPVDKNCHIDLSKETCAEDGKPLEIVRSLEEGAYGIATDDLFI